MRNLEEKWWDLSFHRHCEKRGIHMNYIKGIFEKATIQGIADYLLFGLGPDRDERSYEERLEEPYERFEEAVKKYDKNPTSELLDLSNEIASETASVYTEIGIQIAILLIKDMIGNVNREKLLNDSEKGEGLQIFENDEVIDAIYQAKTDSVLKRNRLSIDKDFRKISEEVRNTDLPEKVAERINNIFIRLNCKIVDYGKIAFIQGFKNAVKIMKNIAD